MIYIDSPVGTGFSYVNDDSYPSDEKTIANDLYTGLIQILFTLQPAYSANPFYIFGESYGGKYVPWLATTILTNNNSPKSGKKINLKAIGIGNGWVDPYIQTGSYGPFLFRHQLINQQELNSASKTYKQFQNAVNQKNYQEALMIGSSLMNDLMSDAGLGDPYDIRKSSDPTVPFANKLSDWLNQASTKKQLKAKGTWELCETGPYYSLENDIDQASVTLLGGIIEKIPVMLYNGDCDLICNMDGTAMYAGSAVSWPGQQQYNQASNVSWNGPSGSAAGTFQSGGGLVRAVVYQAGHMVPFDQPANAQYLVWKFLSGQFN
jgi:carboxypeptidase C (cathepsin A)